MGASGLGAKRISRADSVVSLDGMERKVRSFFLDSGAHSLFNLHCFKTVIKKTKSGLESSRFFKPKSVRYEWYTKDGRKLSKAYKAYMDEYATFVKAQADGIDHYATVDAIYNPDLSWKALKYLEKEHSLKPVPVIHHRTPLHWVEKHLEHGYEFIGLGGLGQQSTKHDYVQWADSVYDLICDNPDRLPCVRTHGFAMLSYGFLVRYPWWSVDSSSAYKVAGFGGIYVPHYRRDPVTKEYGFTFAEEPYQVAFSHRSTAKSVVGKHYDTLTDNGRKVVEKWLDEIQIPMGRIDDTNKVLEYGVASEYNARALANLKFFQKLCQWLPKWPWAFKVKPTSSFFDWGTVK